MFIETLQPEQHQRFMKERFETYLKSQFSDLAMRSQQSKQKGVSSSIDKHTFCKFANLPGFVGSRFFALACDKNERVTKEAFLTLLL